MDPQTINVVASTAVGFLVSYLKKSGEASLKQVGEKIYNAIKDRIGQKPAADEALKDIEETPDDADLQAQLRVQLRKLLTEDEELAELLKELQTEAGNTQAGATIIQQTAGDNAKQFGQVFGNVSFGPE